MSMFSAGHHTEAAQRCDMAATAHRKAAEAYGAGKHMEAGYHAEAAHGHRVEAKRHADEASRFHADYHMDDGDSDDGK